MCSILQISKVNQPESALEYLPTDVVIQIFQSLDVVDVISCQNVCIQTKEAAEYYFNRHFKVFYISCPSFEAISPKSNPFDLEFIDNLLTAVGPYIQTLTVDFLCFPFSLGQPISMIIFKNCNFLRNLSIIGQPDVEIAMPSTQNLEKLQIRNCLFKPFAEIGSCLREMDFSQTDEPAIDLKTLTTQFPGITNLTINTNYLNNDDFQGITSLRNLRILNIEIEKPRNKSEENDLKNNCNLKNLLIKLQHLIDLEEFTLNTPFFKKLPVKVVDVQVKRLRRRTSVVLIVNAEFSGPHGIDQDVVMHWFLVPADLLSMRSDLDGLTAIVASIHFDDFPESMISLEKLVRLQILQLTLCGKEEGNQTHHIDDVLWSLVRGASRKTCKLNAVLLNAEHTDVFGLEHLSAIKAFLRAADKLAHFTLMNCSTELICTQEMLSKLQPNIGITFS